MRRLTFRPKKKPPGGRRFPPGGHASADSLQRRIDRANRIVNVDLAAWAASGSRDTLPRFDATQRDPGLLDRVTVVVEPAADLGIDDAFAVVGEGLADA